MCSLWSKAWIEHSDPVTHPASTPSDHPAYIPLSIIGCKGPPDGLFVKFYHPNICNLKRLLSVSNCKVNQIITKRCRRTTNKLQRDLKQPQRDTNQQQKDAKYKKAEVQSDHKEIQIPPQRYKQQ